MGGDAARTEICEAQIEKRNIVSVYGC